MVVSSEEKQGQGLAVWICFKGCDSIYTHLLALEINSLEVNS